MSRLTWMLVLLFGVVTSGDDVSDQGDRSVFPPGFLFGTATASYQIEGAWNVEGKGENIWDRFTHDHPSSIADGCNGDIAADSYHKFKEDVGYLKDMGMHVYRFSISWARVLPKGEVNFVNQDGVTYYNNLINELLANGIQPMVTMYHWDLPQCLQDFGGWTNPILVTFFEDYARFLYTTFGDRVKWWITFNEPVDTTLGYSEGKTAPGLSQHGVGDYLVAHTILKAHARAYHIYDDEFRASQQGKVSITLNSRWIEPLTNSNEDQQAAYTAMMFDVGWFAHPIYSKTGDYPPVMRERIAHNSLSEGRPRSRLPEFDSYWLEHIKGTWDFFALNHYTTFRATVGESGENPSRGRDSGILYSQDPSWPQAASSWLKVVYEDFDKNLGRWVLSLGNAVLDIVPPLARVLRNEVVPWGFRKVLQFISNEFGNPPIFVTENGFSDHGELNDINRIKYYTSYLRELLKAVHLDKVNVIGYTAWSLMDNFEWERGYTEKFGLYYVDFNDPARPRTPKNSSFVLADIVRTSRIPPAFANEVVLV